MRECGRPPQPDREHRRHPTDKRYVAPATQLPKTESCNRGCQTVDESPDLHEPPSGSGCRKSLGSHRQDKGSCRQRRQQQSNEGNAERTLHAPSGIRIAVAMTTPLGPSGRSHQLELTPRPSSAPDTPGSSPSSIAMQAGQITPAAPPAPATPRQSLAPRCRAECPTPREAVSRAALHTAVHRPDRLWRPLPASAAARFVS